VYDADYLVGKKFTAEGLTRECATFYQADGIAGTCQLE
jgi:hypothetical protein